MPVRSRPSGLLGSARAAGIAMVACSLLAARPASAAPAIRIAGAPIRNVLERADGPTFNWISRSDCASDDVFHFSLAIDEGSGLFVEIWAGQGSTDCAQPVARFEPTALCLRVFAGPADPAVQLVDVRTRDLAAIESLVFGSEGQCRGTLAHCDPPGGRTIAANITLHFLLLGSSADAIARTSWSSQIDLVAPSPPTNLSAANRGGALEVNFSLNPDPDVFGYDALCNPSDSPAGCTSTALVPGQTTTREFVGTYLCGTTRMLPEIVTDALVHGQPTAVSVVAFDQVGNVGRLSELACATPLYDDPRSSLMITGCDCSLGRTPGKPHAVTAVASWVACAALLRKRRTRGGTNRANSAERR